MSKCYTVVVEPKDPLYDVVGKRVLHQARDFGLEGVSQCRASRLFFLQGDLDAEEIDRLARILLIDPLTEQASFEVADGHFIDVALRPGVTDSEGENLLEASHALGFSGLQAAARGDRYQLGGSHKAQDLERFAGQVLSNEVVELYAVDQPLPPPFIPHPETKSQPQVVPLLGLNRAQLEALSKQFRLALNGDEMEALQGHYQKLDRDPTQCELETFAQTWSEHCVHKTFRASIEYSENGQTQTVDGLLPILRKTTEELDLDWVVSAFVDNAGIVRFHEDWNLALKAETHNHPSALEPFGGANTGVGGVIRDILGVSARPLANWDVLCFGPLDAVPPEGSLPPTQVMAGVVHGVADYGNKMGIPTVAGAVVFHPGYTANPLVYCGCLGILAQGGHPTEIAEGDLIVLIGGKTGRDGLGGATFSSLEMDETTAQECGTAVQIGNPITEKVAGELVLEANRRKLYSAVTDCGAGGLASAIGEMGEELGAVVHLERVPTKYPGLTPRELWLSEAQERMVLAVPPQNWEALKALSRHYSVVCVSLGHFGNQGYLDLFHGETRFANLKTEYLHGGIPRQQLKAVWQTPQIEERLVEVDPAEALLTLLKDPNICSRETILRRYDHEVQGGTAVKPLSMHDGPGDGVALVPLELQHLDHPPAAVIGCGIAPELTELDPRLGTLSALDEAIRNVVAVGADPTRISLLDNFSWGNPKLPDRLGKLTRSVLACAEGSRLHRAPFVSGKDSLNNEFLETDGTRRAIPGTILITAVGILPDVHQRVTTSFKTAGNPLYLLGEDSPAMGGSAYLRILGGASGNFPEPNPQAPELYQAYHRATRRGLVAACHDLSEGGLAVALAESCLAGALGAQVETPVESLFSEAPSRLLVEVPKDQEAEFLECLQGQSCRLLGQVQQAPNLTIKGVLELPLERLGQAHHFDNFSCLQGSRESRDRVHSAPVSVPAKLSKKQPVGILCAPGTNREQDAAAAIRLAGGDPQVIMPGDSFEPGDYAMVVLPGGFSFGDDLGAGRLWALQLSKQWEQLQEFVASGGAVLGICNGFQALLRSGLLLSEQEQATLTHNICDHFECRWVDLEVNPQSNSLFTRGLSGVIRCPVAHGEGRFACDQATGARLQSQGRIPLSYVGGGYPHNPNGSLFDIAGICNPEGTVMGLMPHPENNIFSWQSDPGEPGPLTGLALFRNALRNLA